MLIADIMMPNLNLTLLFAGLLCLPVGCHGKSSPKQPPEQLTQSTQIKPGKSSFKFETSRAMEELAITYQNGESANALSILESLGGGVATVDYDLDGNVDLYFPGGGLLKENQVSGLPGRLIRQLEAGHLEDVTVLAEIDVAKQYSHGCFSADFDADGFEDLLVTGYGGVTLWHNLGEGTFEDVTREVHLDDTSWSSAAAWGDYNGDGIVDVYLTHYVDWSFQNNPPCNGPSGRPDVCPPRQFEGLDDLLYYGQPDGKFILATSSGLLPNGKGLGVICFDADQDHDLDLYVANDTTPNFLYLNRNNGTFEEQGVVSGIALDDMGIPNGSMGITLLDYNRDGLPDIGVANYEGELFGLYQNSGHGLFEFTSRYTGINQIGNHFVGFGCVADDFDGDGDEDIVIANGHVVHFPLNSELNQTPILLEQTAKNHFERVENETIGTYFASKWIGRGLAKADFNNDGMMDLVFVNTNQKAALLHNTASKSNESFSLTVKLSGTVSDRNAIGAQIVLKTQSTQQVRTLFGGGSYLSSSQRLCIFHHNKSNPVETLRIIWPGGKQTDIPASSLPLESTTLTLKVVEPTAGQTEPQILLDAN